MNDTESECKYHDEFYGAFMGSGSIYVECDFCGRLHIADDDIGYLEDDDIKYIEQFEKDNPDKVVHCDCNSISWTWMGEKQMVFDCQCGYDKIICDFFIDNRHRILKFFTGIVKSEKLDAEQNEKMLLDASGGKMI